jgi:hypothetical protein
MIREPWVYVLKLPPDDGGNFYLQNDSDASFTWLKTCWDTESGDIPTTPLSATHLKSGRLIWQGQSVYNVAGTGELPFLLVEPITLKPSETLLFTVDGPVAAPSTWPDDEGVVMSFAFDNSKPLAPGEILDDQFFPHVIGALTTLQGSPTGASFETLNTFSGFNVGGGNPALSLPPYISGDGMSEGWFINDATVFDFQFTGLSDGQYDVIFAGVRDEPDFGNHSGRVTLVTGSSQSPSVQVFNGSNPVSGTEAPHVTFERITPSGGVIALSCSGFGAFNRCYLNTLAIVKKPAQNQFQLILHGYKTYETI